MCQRFQGKCREIFYQEICQNVFWQVTPGADSHRVKKIARPPAWWVRVEYSIQFNSKKLYWIITTVFTQLYAYVYSLFSDTKKYLSHYRKN